MFLWMSQFYTWLIMSLDFSQEILAAIWEEKKILPTISISTSHKASFDASHLCEGGKKEIQSSLPSLLLNQCIIHVFVSESGEFNVQK